MASPLYFERFVAKQGAIIKVELSIIHPDVSEFGTDRLFAWKLLYDWVSPVDDNDDSAADHDDGWHPSLHQQRFAVLSRHANSRAKEYVQAQLPKWQEGGYGLPYLAAMGMETELRQMMVKALRGTG